MSRWEGRWVAKSDVKPQGLQDWLSEDVATKCLESLVGSWQDQKDSYYALVLSRDGSALDVSTKRPNGAVQKTSRLIHIEWKGQSGRIVWGHGGPKRQYIVESGDSDTINWKRHLDGVSAFKWKRASKTSERESSEEPQAETGGTPQDSPSGAPPPTRSAGSHAHRARLRQDFQAERVIATGSHAHRARLRQGFSAQRAQTLAMAEAPEDSWDEEEAVAQVKESPDGGKAGRQLLATLKGDGGGDDSGSALLATLKGDSGGGSNAGSALLATLKGDNGSGASGCGRDSGSALLAQLKGDSGGGGGGGDSGSAPDWPGFRQDEILQLNEQEAMEATERLLAALKMPPKKGDKEAELHPANAMDNQANLVSTDQVAQQELFAMQPLMMSPAQQAFPSMQPMVAVAPAMQQVIQNSSNVYNFNLQGACMPQGAMFGLPLPQQSMLAMPTPIPVPMDVRHISEQVEFWFSDHNLSRDMYMRSLMHGEGWVPLNILQEFPRLKAMSVDLWALRQAIVPSMSLELDCTAFYVRIRDPQRRAEWCSVSMPWV